MSEQTTPIERFKDEYNAVPTTEIEYVSNPDENVYINPEQSLIVGPEFVGRTFNIGKDNLLREVSLTTVERTHDGRERTFYKVEGKDAYFQENLIDAVSDLFETPVSDMVVQTNNFNGAYLILIQGPDDLQAIVSPFLFA